jgi:hypothetical protein
MTPPEDPAVHLTVMAIDHLTRYEITSDIERIRSVLNVAMFTPGNAGHPLFHSALTELLIKLRDLLAKSEKFSKRVCFQDDVIIKGKVNDVTALVCEMRFVMLTPASTITMKSRLGLVLT